MARGRCRDWQLCDERVHGMKRKNIFGIVERTLKHVAARAYHAIAQSRCALAVSRCVLVSRAAVPMLTALGGIS